MRCCQLLRQGTQLWIKKYAPRRNIQPVLCSSSLRLLCATYCYYSIFHGCYYSIFHGLNQPTQKMPMLCSGYCVR